jgi:large subunit ribosomal protein L6
MSRIGRLPVGIPEGVVVSTDQDVVRVRGPLGELTLRLPEGISLVEGGGEATSGGEGQAEAGEKAPGGVPVGAARVVRVQRASDDRRARACHGLVRALLANSVVGVSQGFRKELEIVGVGYRATLLGPGELELSLGFSHPVRYRAPEGVTFEVPTPTRIVVKGIDKQVVGQVAAEIRRFRPPEPYKGKGIKYSDEVILRKAGKAGK